jgi:hypothetical protein
MSLSKTAPTAAQLFPRDLSESGWIYRSKEDHVFALKALILGFDLLAFDEFLERELSGPKSKDVREWLVERRTHACAALQAKDLSLGEAILEMLHVYYQLVRREDVLLPKAKHGMKFVAKKPGGVGPVRKAIARVLKSNPTFTAEQVWQCLKANPPKGLEFHGSAALRHVWSTGRQNTGWRRFQNIVSEEKTKLKG